MELDTLRELRALAKRVSHRADDLLQDTLVAALQAGRDDLPWLVGTMQNQAAMAARSAVRRRQREAQAAQDDQAGHAAEAESTPDARGTDARAFLQRLPPSARRVAVLALHGLDAGEIQWILGLAPTAFRQRLTTIRKRLAALSASRRSEALALAYVRDPARTVELQFGLVRRALKAALRGQPGLATHDVDGHLLVLRPAAHTSAPRGNEPVGTNKGDLP